MFFHLLDIRDNFQSAENNEDDANLSVETRFSWTKKKTVIVAADTPQQHKIPYKPQEYTKYNLLQILQESPKWR